MFIVQRSDGKSGGFSFSNINPRTYAGATVWVGDVGNGEMLWNGAANPTGSFSTGFIYADIAFHTLHLMVVMQSGQLILLIVVEMPLSPSTLLTLAEILDLAPISICHPMTHHKSTGPYATLMEHIRFPFSGSTTLPRQTIRHSFYCVHGTLDN